MSAEAGRMSMADEQPPVLFRPRDGEASPGAPAVLLGGRCGACGRVFFPMQAYGCEACGAQDLAPTTLGGRGRLVASARVHIHAGPGREAPFTVGSVQLDDGPLVRALLDVGDSQPLTPGTRMQARLAPETRPERGPYDLRFAPANDGER